jgi:hypothetical protein
MLEHFPAKWMPVCVEKMRQNKELELSSASMEVEKALASMGPKAGAYYQSVSAARWRRQQ